MINQTATNINGKMIASMFLAPCHDPSEALPPLIAVALGPDRGVHQGLQPDLDGPLEQPASEALPVPKMDMSLRSRSEPQRGQTIFNLSSSSWERKK
jgi:hypothetical protein